MIECRTWKYVSVLEKEYKAIKHPSEHEPVNDDLSSMYVRLSWCWTINILGNDCIMYIHSNKYLNLLMESARNGSGVYVTLPSLATLTGLRNRYIRVLSKMLCPFIPFASSSLMILFTSFYNNICNEKFGLCFSCGYFFHWQTHISDVLKYEITLMT